MRGLPRSESETTNGPQFDGSDLYGAPVTIFPRWWVCPVCRQLAPLSSGVFERSKQTYPPKNPVSAYGLSESQKTAGDSGPHSRCM